MNQAATFFLSPKVPVQRVTKYPLLLSRLHKVTPAANPDRQEILAAKERIEAALERMNKQPGAGKSGVVGTVRRR